jgi:Fe2+ transport system protein FeoA
MNTHTNSSLLTSLRALDTARIVTIESSIANHLSGYGIFPGAVVELQQKFPGYVIKTDETEIALEAEVASQIRVVKI